MAMTSSEPSDDVPSLSAQDEAFLAEAAGTMRAHADPRWVEVSSRVLDAALRATRRSQPVKAQAPGGTVYVSEQVIIAYLREAIDGRIPGTAVAAIHLDITGKDTFSGVLIEMIVQYGTEILPAADRARATAAAVLHELLGTAATEVHVRAGHVHVSDVTEHDPQTTEPARTKFPFG